MLHEVYHTIMLLGCIQGFIFGVIAIAFKKYRSRSTLFLGILILAFSYNIFQNYLVISGKFNLNSYFGLIYIPVSSLFMVLYFLYVKTFLFPRIKLRIKDYLLFLPFVIVFAVSVIEKIIFNNDSQTVVSEFFNEFRLGQEIFNIVYSLILIISSYLLIKKFNQRQLTRNSKSSILNTHWLRNTTFILLALCLYWIVPLYIEFASESINPINFYYILWLGLTLTIYILGHIGLYQHGVNLERHKIKNLRQNTESQTPIAFTPIQNEHLIAFKNYIKEEKNFLNHQLSLELVATELQINKSYLSRLINTELEINFNDFINELRVEEAKIYLNNPEFSNYTLLAIGLESGFNSKSSFNTSFKKFTGMTPSEYKKKELMHINSNKTNERLGG